MTTSCRMQSDGEPVLGNGGAGVSPAWRVYGRDARANTDRFMEDPHDLSFAHEDPELEVGAPASGPAPLVITAPDRKPALPSMGRAGEKAAFTLIELLTVIAIIALLAGLIVGGTRYAGTQMKVSRIRAELNKLEAAIEAYHAKFNHYPPDNVVQKVPLIVNPVTNSLYYELTGVIADDAKGTFRSPNQSAGIQPALFQQYFGVDGVENAGANAREIKPFLADLKSGQYRPVNPNTTEPEVYVLAVPVPWPLGRQDQPVPSARGLNPWRYVSTQPTNNAATFDLWAEYVDGGKIKIICNWSKDILEK